MQSSHREAVQDVEPGASVDLATTGHDYANPLQVASVPEREVWETPAGPDMLVATLQLRGQRTTYTARYNDAHERFVLEGNSTKQRITDFEIVEEDAPDSTDDEPTEDWDVSFPVPDHVTPSLVEEAAGRCLTLQSMLEYIEWPDGDARARDRLRALSHSLGLYEEFVEPEAWDRDRARERGWQ